MQSTTIIDRNNLGGSRNTLLSLVQREVYHVKFRALEKNEVVPRASRLLELNPVIQQNLLKVGQRIKHAKIPHNSKYPIILTPNHAVTNLIIDDIHKTFHHCSREHCLSLSREKYWIVNDKTDVKRVLAKCLYCKKMKTRTKPQVMVELPKKVAVSYSRQYRLFQTTTNQTI